ncbi:MAG: LamG domain-containing protein [Phycisphaerae bacterium]|nr:LamG domain-containing protein [Phycisphaerae bacterium]
MASRSDTPLTSGRRSARHGVALVLVLLLVAVATVLGLAALATSTVRQTGSENLSRASQATYAGESGLAHGLWMLRSAPEDVPDTEDEALGWFQQGASDDRYKFYAVGAGGGTYTIHALGQCGELTRRVNMTVVFDSAWYDGLQRLNPESYWRLNERWGGVARDSAGSNHGRYRGVSRQRDSAVAHDGDYSAEFDGTNDYVNLREIELDDEALTLLAWFKADDWDRDDAEVLCKASGTARRRYHWALGTEGRGGEIRLRFTLRAGGVTRELVAASGDCPADEWVFAAAVYDGERMRLYKDGVQVGSRRHRGEIDEGEDVDAWIGGNPAGARTRPWDGCIDEVAIIREALTADQISALWLARVADVEVLSYGDDE